MTSKGPSLMLQFLRLVVVLLVSCVVLGTTKALESEVNDDGNQPLPEDIQETDVDLRQSRSFKLSTQVSGSGENVGFTQLASLPQYPLWKVHKYHGIEIRPVQIIDQPPPITQALPYLPAPASNYGQPVKTYGAPANNRPINQNSPSQSYDTPSLPAQQYGTPAHIDYPGVIPQMQQTNAVPDNYPAQSYNAPSDIYSSSRQTYEQPIKDYKATYGSYISSQLAPTTNYVAPSGPYISPQETATKYYSAPLGSIDSPQQTLPGSAESFDSSQGTLDSSSVSTPPESSSSDDTPTDTSSLDALDSLGALTGLLGGGDSSGESPLDALSAFSKIAKYLPNGDGTKPLSGTITISSPGELTLFPKLEAPPFRVEISPRSDTSVSKNIVQDRVDVFKAAHFAADVSKVRNTIRAVNTLQRLLARKKVKLLLKPAAADLAVGGKLVTIKGGIKVIPHVVNHIVGKKVAEVALRLAASHPLALPLLTNPLLSKLALPIKIAILKLPGLTKLHLAFLLTLLAHPGLIKLIHPLLFVFLKHKALSKLPLLLLLPILTNPIMPKILISFLTNPILTKHNLPLGLPGYSELTKLPVPLLKVFSKHPALLAKLPLPILWPILSDPVLPKLIFPLLLVFIKHPILAKLPSLPLLIPFLLDPMLLKLLVRISDMARPNIFPLKSNLHDLKQGLIKGSVPFTIPNPLSSIIGHDISNNPLWGGSDASKHPNPLTSLLNSHLFTLLGEELSNSHSPSSIIGPHTLNQSVMKGIGQSRLSNPLSLISEFLRLPGSTKLPDPLTLLADPILSTALSVLPALFGTVGSNLPQIIPFGLAPLSSPQPTTPASLPALPPAFPLVPSDARPYTYLPEPLKLPQISGMAKLPILPPLKFPTPFNFKPTGLGSPYLKIKFPKPIITIETVLNPPPKTTIPVPTTYRPPIYVTTQQSYGSLHAATPAELSSQQVSQHKTPETSYGDPRIVAPLTDVESQPAQQFYGIPSAETPTDFLRQPAQQSYGSPSAEAPNDFSSQPAQDIYGGPSTEAQTDFSSQPAQDIYGGPSAEAPTDFSSQPAQQYYGNSSAEALTDFSSQPAQQYYGSPSAEAPTDFSSKPAQQSYGISNAEAPTDFSGQPSQQSYGSPDSETPTDFSIQLAQQSYGIPNSEAPSDFSSQQDQQSYGRPTEEAPTDFSSQPPQNFYESPSAEAPTNFLSQPDQQSYGSPTAAIMSNFFSLPTSQYETPVWQQKESRPLVNSYGLPIPSYEFQSRPVSLPSVTELIQPQQPSTYTTLITPEPQNGIYNPQHGPAQNAPYLSVSKSGHYSPQMTSYSETIEPAAYPLAVNISSYQTPQTGRYPPALYTKHYSSPQTGTHPFAVEGAVQSGPYPPAIQSDQFSLSSLSRSFTEDEISDLTSTLEALDSLITSSGSQETEINNSLLGEENPSLQVLDNEAPIFHQFQVAEHNDRSDKRIDGETPESFGGFQPSSVAAFTGSGYSRVVHQRPALPVAQEPAMYLDSAHRSAITTTTPVTQELIMPTSTDTSSTSSEDTITNTGTEGKAMSESHTEVQLAGRD